MPSPKDGRASFRYHDTSLRCAAIKVLPGEYYVGREDTALTTVLGSCVSACLTDLAAGVGGMNHFMLPDGAGVDGASARYGVFAMEILVNELLSRGAKRERLKAKVVGGGNVLPGFVTDPIGTRNAEFVRRFLAEERIGIVAEDLLGAHARRLAYFPATGRTLVRTVGTPVDVLESEQAYRKRLSAQPIGGEMELF